MKFLVPHSVPRVFIYNFKMNAIPSLKYSENPEYVTKPPRFRNSDFSSERRSILHDTWEKVTCYNMQRQGRGSWAIFTPPKK